MIYGLWCLKYAIENGCEWDADTCYHSAKENADCLRYLHQLSNPWTNGPWADWTSAQRINNRPSPQCRDNEPMGSVGMPSEQVFV